MILERENRSVLFQEINFIRWAIVYHQGCRCHVIGRIVRTPNTSQWANILCRRSLSSPIIAFSTLLPMTVVVLLLRGHSVVDTVTVVFCVVFTIRSIHGHQYHHCQLEIRVLKWN